MTTNTVQAGDIWSIPVADVGHFGLVVARVAPASTKVPMVLVFLYMQPFANPPAPADIAPLAQWSRAWIGTLPMRPFANGRWQRVGTVANFKPEEWPVLPCAAGQFDREPADDELFSIETTQDTATATVLDNCGVDRTTASAFPRVSGSNGASDLEAALRKYALGRQPGFFDLELEVTSLDAARLDVWSTWAAAARHRGLQRGQPTIPAGMATDRSVRPGHWLGMPLLGGGFGVAMVIARGPGVAIFADALIYGFSRVFDGFPTVSQLEQLGAADACCLIATSLVVVRSGRWRLLGPKTDFDPADWAYPPRWFQSRSQSATGTISLVGKKGSATELQIPSEVLALDPASGELLNRVHTPRSVEAILGHFAHGPADRPLHPSCRRVHITPDRQAAWLQLRVAIGCAALTGDTSKASEGATRMGKDGGSGTVGAT